ncbi:MAG: aminotransferase class I/II-fold pyridoxal phosphate-dependent enzyme [Planctomycetota bacterium]|nr:aminotransferase class I/II-fold pyridoxal phosphate-dependent enzyme [Planctomycetota bacterium]
MKNTIPENRPRASCRAAPRLESMSGYAFDELDRMRDARLAAGVDVIDFGVGDPTESPPDVVVEAAQRGLDAHRRSGYPSYNGSHAFRSAVSTWFSRRHGVTLDAETCITSSVGSKEAVFHLPLAFVAEGEVVLVPSPGYPPYARGTAMAGGRVCTYAVTPDGPLLPDLDSLAPDVSEALRVVWITQPHVPTGRCATLEELTHLANQCRERGVLLCSDEAYSELWLERPAVSALETGLEGVLVFQSLSKRAAMTSYRVGFVAGDPEAVATFRRLKLNVDSGTPAFIQEAAVVALEDDEASKVARAEYARRIDALLPALRELGCEAQRPQAGFYLWIGTPGGQSGLEFARRLLSEAPALVVMPGEWLSDPVAKVARQPGDGKVRLAVVPSHDRCLEAAERLRQWHQQ